MTQIGLRHRRRVALQGVGALIGLVRPDLAGPGPCCRVIRRRRRAGVGRSTPIPCPVLTGRVPAAVHLCVHGHGADRLPVGA